MQKILTSEVIGAKLRELRKRRGLSQEQLAEKIDVTYQQIQQYENGSTKLNTDKLQAAAIALSVPISAFFIERNNETILSEEELMLVNGFRALQTPEVRSFVLRSLTNTKLPVESP